MAGASSTPATFFLGFRRSGCGTETSPIFPLQTRANVPPIRHSYRFGIGTGGLHVNRRVPIVFASGVNPPPNPDAGKGKAGSSSSSVADGPPLPTILAGIVVFLLACWVIGSIIMWLVGLIVNVPPS